MIPFNVPHRANKELDYILEAVNSKKISGDGMFTKKCHDFFEKRYGLKKALLTTSCTDALEMAALLLEIKPGDEIIVPSYTFVSTANAFVLRGAKIVFADSGLVNPNIDPLRLADLITPRTKAIVVVHYAGIACDMDPILDLARAHNLYVVEDAAQAVESFYKGRPLGSIGSFGAFSFHETKNVISGEGGMLAVNDSKFVARAEIIREKGTNRTAFFRGEVDKYNWVDLGSSFLPSDIVAAFLFAQLECIDDIQKTRLSIWNQYFEGLKALAEQGLLGLPFIPSFATNNAHMFYVVCSSLTERTALSAFLKKHKINSVFHYLSLHKSPYYQNKYHGPQLMHAERYSDCLLRLPMFYALKSEDVQKVIEAIHLFYRTKV